MGPLSVLGPNISLTLCICMNGCWVQPQTAGSDGQMSLSDLETVKVIGKGSGGVVQLVRHKWTNSIYALKVIYCLDGLLLFIFI